MADVTAADVKRLREATGAGMMDCKKALVENDGDFEAAALWMREKGLVKAAERAERENTEGAVGFFSDGGIAAAVELKSETDFVAQNPDFVALANGLAAAVASAGEGAIDQKKDDVDNLKLVLKENIEVGKVLRFEAAPGNVVGDYQHVQGSRTKIVVLIELAGGTAELAHDIAVHAAFTKPEYLAKDEVSDEVLAAERATLEVITRNEGKPEAAIPKIVEGRMGGFFKDRVLLEQPYVKDEKQTIAQLLGGATLVRFGIVEIGAK